MTLHRKTISLALTCCLMAAPLLLAEGAMAAAPDNNSPFGSGTDFLPLTNPNAPLSTGTPAPAVKPDNAGGLSPSVEETLKPMTPFVDGVEKKLSITITTPKGQDLPTLVERLNHIQDILFGGRVYTDAGQLLAKLGQTFPEEAAKEQTYLQQQAQKAMLSPSETKKHHHDHFANHDDAAANSAATLTPPAPATVPVIPDYGRVGDGNAYANQPPQQTPAYNPANPAPAYNNTPSYAPSYNSGAPNPSLAGPTFPGQSYDNSNNGSFGAEATQNGADASSSNNGGGLKSIGQGLMNLALIGGSLAGAYYLNKHGGSSTTTQTPYNYPYYGGYSPYGIPYTAISPYGSLIPQQGMLPYGSTTMYTTPYSGLNYGTNTVIQGPSAPVFAPGSYGNPYYGNPYGAPAGGLGSLLQGLF